jgi:GNAT superfamily N-acetyltransferase
MRTAQSATAYSASEPDLRPGSFAAGDADPCPGLSHAGHARAVRGPGDFWLRPPARGDLPLITAMWERCSLGTRLARFHAPVRNIPAAYLETVLSDPSAHVVALPRRAGAVAALASLVSCGHGSAELGVLVEDDWQRHGIGRQLVEYLIATAPDRQITELTASILAQNAKVADLLRRVPGEFSLTRDGATLNVRVRLACRAAAGHLLTRADGHEQRDRTERTTAERL